MNSAAEMAALGRDSIAIGGIHMEKSLRNRLPTPSGISTRCVVIWHHADGLWFLTQSGLVSGFALAGEGKCGEDSTGQCGWIGKVHVAVSRY
jgi:hypothetical protein